MSESNVVVRFRIFRDGEFVREQMCGERVIKIGKLASSHVQLVDDSVSRMHCVLEVLGPDDVSVIDLGSTLGTYVNDKMVNKARVRSGDILRVGRTRLDVEIVATQPATSAWGKTSTRRCRTCGFVAEFPLLDWISSMVDASQHASGQSVTYYQATTCTCCWSSDVECKAGECADRPRRRRAVARCSFEFLDDSPVEFDVTGAGVHLDLIALNELLRIGNVHMVEHEAGPILIGGQTREVIAHVHFWQTIGGVPRSATLVTHRIDLDGRVVELLYEDWSFDECAEPSELQVEFCEVPMGRAASA